MAELTIGKEDKEELQEIKPVEPISTASRSYSDYANTMEALRQAEVSVPEYSSDYDRDIEELYDKIVSRKAFSYEPSRDMLYNNYREQYQRMGRSAMKDSIGQAAALTGGYDNSYGQTVGQQQYGAYLQKLGEIMPELYEAAYQRYRDEGDAMLAGYELLTEREKNDYDRYRDKISDMQFRQELAADMDNELYKRKWQSYESLMDLISSTGYEPSQEELKGTGMTQAQAEALRKEYLRINGLSEDGEENTEAKPMSDYVMNYLYGTATKGSKSQYKLSMAGK